MNNKVILIVMISLLLQILGCKPKQGNHSKSPDEKQAAASVVNSQDTPQYSVLTKEILSETSDDGLEKVIYNNISLRMKEAREEEYKFIQSLPRGQRAIYATWIAEGEVNNGGFDQFYTNTSSQFAEMAAEGFRLIGAEKFAALVDKANRFYEENKEKIDAYWDEIEENDAGFYEENPLNKYDERFYALYQEENLNQLKIQYIRKHPEEFIQDDIFKQYEGSFECKEDSSTMKISYKGDQRYKVIFKGEHFVNGEQVRNMKLIPDKRTLYFEKDGVAGGLIYSEDYNSVEAVGGSNERPIYKRTE
jgi:hypothetical protein